MSGELSYEGNIRINGHDVKSLQPWQLAAIRGVLPQASVISFPFTVREVVRMGLTSGLNRNPAKAEQTAQKPWHRSISAATRAASISSFPAANSSACSLPAFSARSRTRHRWKTALAAARRAGLQPRHQPPADHHAPCPLVLRQRRRRHRRDARSEPDGSLRRPDPSDAVRAALAAFGTIHEVLTDDTMQSVFGCPLRINARAGRRHALRPRPQRHQRLTSAELLTPSGVKPLIWVIAGQYSFMQA
jgi:iron complex transport system ATP-binding protein